MRNRFILIPVKRVTPRGQSVDTRAEPDVLDNDGLSLDIFVSRVCHLNAPVVVPIMDSVPVLCSCLP